MTFFIADACIDVLDRSCVEECPVDCIYEGDRKAYINPLECIDCGACEAVCPVTAISSDRNATDKTAPWRDDNREFFTSVLPGKGEPIGTPGGAMILCTVGVDTPLAAQAVAG